MVNTHIDNTNPKQDIVAVKCIRYDPNNAAIRPRILSVSGTHLHEIYSLTCVFQALDEERNKWSSLCHPNLCPLWSIRSPTDCIVAVAMPWLSNSNIIDFIRQNPDVNKLPLVRYFIHDCATLFTYHPLGPSSCERYRIYSFSGHHAWQHRSSTSV